MAAETGAAPAASPAPSVVHLLWGSDVGGIERLVHDLAAEQLRRGQQVSVAFGQADGPFAHRIRALDVAVIDLQLRSGQDIWPSRIRRGAGLLARSELIHAHGFNIPMGAVMRRSRRPVVFTEHGQFGLGRRLGAKGVLKLRAQRRFLRSSQVAAIAANSAWTAELLSRSHGIVPERVAVVHNGIEPDGAQLSSDVRDDAVVVFVGRLKPFKRVDRLIRALACVERDDRPLLLIAGRGPLENDLRDLAQDLGVDGRVRFLGWRADIDALLAGADAIALPSEGEPFGLAMLEGSARGLLPIAFADGGGALECITPDGIVVNGVDDLAMQLSALKPGSALLSPEARRSRAAWARENFSIALTAARYAELYESALAAGKPRS